MEEVISRLDEHFALWLFALMWLDSMNVPLPSEIPLLYGGYLVSRGDTTFPAAVAIAGTGAVCGSLAMYALSRTLGRAGVLRWGRRIGITHEQLERAEDWFARKGGAAVFVCRMIPLARTLISVPAGVAEMPVGRFLAYTAAGTFVWTAAVVGLGWSLGENWRRVLDSFSLASMIAAAVVVAVGVTWFVRRRRARASTQPRQPE